MATYPIYQVSLRIHTMEIERRWRRVKVTVRCRRLLRLVFGRHVNSVSIGGSTDSTPLPAWGEPEYGSRRPTIHGLLLAYIQSCPPEQDGKQMRASTTHDYEGREALASIVLDTLQRRYLFIHPVWCSAECSATRSRTLRTRRGIYSTWSLHQLVAG